MVTRSAARLLPIRRRAGVGYAARAARTAASALTTPGAEPHASALVVAVPMSRARYGRRRRRASGSPPTSGPPRRPRAAPPSTYRTGRRTRRRAERKHTYAGGEYFGLA